MTATSLAVRGLDARPLRSLLRMLGRWEGTLVLVYHRIGDASRSSLYRGVFSATAEGFAEQLDVLARDAEVVDAASASSPATARGRRVAITFDDGYRDTATVAWPLLAERGLPATVFLATGYLDAPRLAWWDELSWLANRAGWSPEVADRHRARYATLPSVVAEKQLDELATSAGVGRAPEAAAASLWMDWDDVRRLHRAGVTFGGHTVTHPVLSRVTDARLAEEIEGCRAALTDRLGLPMALFSYPLGGPYDWDVRAHAPLRRAGVELAFTCAGGRVRPGNRSPLAAPRACAPPGGRDGAARCRAALALPEVFARW